MLSGNISNNLVQRYIHLSSTIATIESFTCKITYDMAETVPVIRT